jgi:uncharacterized membrane protein YkvA (DUF1232 family)
MNYMPYLKHYSPQGFWQKLGPRARLVGRSALEKALFLYYAAQDEKTPKWAKRVIYAALGYFIFPLDAIPDLAPLVGYTDDLSVMVAALATVAFYVTPAVKARAREKLDDWFGPASSPPDMKP